jgi:hypothetical protein
VSGIESEVDSGCKLGAKCTQFAPNFTDFSSPNHPITVLECVAGTTGLELATAAVTASLFVDRIVDQVSQPSYASSSVSALHC